MDFQQGFDGQMVVCNVEGKMVLAGKLTSDPLDDVAVALSVPVRGRTVRIVVEFPDEQKCFPFEITLAKGCYLGFGLRGGDLELIQNEEPFEYD